MYGVLIEGLRYFFSPLSLALFQHLRRCQQGYGREEILIDLVDHVPVCIPYKLGEGEEYSVFKESSGLASNRHEEDKPSSTSAQVYI